MYELIHTNGFDKWLDGLKDPIAQSKIAIRLRALGMGHLGNWKSVAKRVWELKIDTGPGYRVYCTRQKGTIIIVLAGGDKSSQARDIKRAEKLAADLERQS